MNTSVTCPVYRLPDALADRLWTSYGMTPRNLPRRKSKYDEEVNGMCLGFSLHKSHTFSLAVLMGAVDAVLTATRLSVQQPPFLEAHLDSAGVPKTPIPPVNNLTALVGGPFGSPMPTGVPRGWVCPEDRVCTDMRQHRPHAVREMKVQLQEVLRNVGNQSSQGSPRVVQSTRPSPFCPLLGARLEGGPDTLEQLGGSLVGGAP